MVKDGLGLSCNFDNKAKSALARLLELSLAIIIDLCKLNLVLVTKYHGLQQILTSRGNSWVMEFYKTCNLSKYILRQLMFNLINHLFILKIEKLL